MAKIVPRPQLSAFENIYFIEIFKGMFRTMKHAVHTLRKPDELAIVSYPEVSYEVPRDYRSQHRLMKRPDGSPRCVACYMCSTACPAHCIDIVAEDAPDTHIEKRPASFNIDLLLCIYCGLCVEACPCDAIRMDTKKAVIVDDARAKFIIDKDTMLGWNPQDYPDTDRISQEAPGGSQNQDALTAFQSGSGH